VLTKLRRERQTFERHDNALPAQAERVKREMTNQIQEAGSSACKAILPWGATLTHFPI